MWVGGWVGVSYVCGGGGLGGSGRAAELERRTGFGLDVLSFLRPTAPCTPPHEAWAGNSCRGGAGPGVHSLLVSPIGATRSGRPSSAKRKAKSSRKPGGMGAAPPGAAAPPPPLSAKPGPARPVAAAEAAAAASSESRSCKVPRRCASGGCVL